MAIWTLLASVLKGIGKGIVTGSKAIGFAGKEMGKGMVGIQSKSSPLSLSSTGSAAGVIAKSGQIANQVGNAVGKLSGFQEQVQNFKTTGDPASSSLDKTVDTFRKLTEANKRNPEDSIKRSEEETFSQPLAMQSTTAPTTGGPLAQEDLELLRRYLNA